MKDATIGRAPAGSSVDGMVRREPEAMPGVPLETIDLVHILAIDKRGGVVIPKEVREKMDGHGGREILLVAEMVNGTMPLITLVPANRPLGKPRGEPWMQISSAILVR
jgi:AbrB family looped-hinge helix DNA binding protein